MGYDTTVETTLTMSAVALLRAAQAIGQEGCRLRDEARVQHAETVMLRHKGSWAELQHRIGADRLLAEGTEMVRAAYALSRVAQQAAGTSATHALPTADLDVHLTPGPPQDGTAEARLMRMVQDMWEALPPDAGCPGGEAASPPSCPPLAPLDDHDDPFA
jgi:hypothetical protein